MQDRFRMQMGSKELFLSGHAKELSDFAIRSTDLRRWRGGDRNARRDSCRDGFTSYGEAHQNSFGGRCRETNIMKLTA